MGDALPLLLELFLMAHLWYFPERSSRHTHKRHLSWYKFSSNRSQKTLHENQLLDEGSCTVKSARETILPVLVSRVTYLSGGRAHARGRLHVYSYLYLPTRDDFRSHGLP